MLYRDYAFSSDRQLGAVGTAWLHVLCPFSDPAGRERGRASQSDFRADGLSDVGRGLCGCVDVTGLIDGDYMH